MEYKQVETLKKYIEQLQADAFEEGVKVATKALSTQMSAIEKGQIRHGKWHIMSEDLYDESDAPKEAGIYRVIDIDGREYTDEFFGTPRLTKDGIGYWALSEKPLRAWAKMDEEIKDE